MKFSHCEEVRNERLLDILTDEDRGLRIIVSRHGAELVSLARRDANGSWTGFLYRDNEIDKPASGWGNHATVMGYFLHRLKDEHSLYRGREIRGGTHSFLRHKLFADVSVDLGACEGASLTYRISPNEIAPEEYPLKVSLALTYTLRGEELAVRFRFQNHEPELTAHLEFGLHPGFAATSFDTFQFEMPPGRYRRWFSPGNYLTGDTATIDYAGGEMPFDRSALPGSYILELVDVPHRTSSTAIYQAVGVPPSIASRSRTSLCGQMAVPFSASSRVGVSPIAMNSALSKTRTAFNRSLRAAS